MFPSSAYSPERRTALVLTGSGLDGVYHAGVLKALDEAGVKIDLVCGRGIGAVGALFTAIGGGAALWDSGGLWRSDRVTRLYHWSQPLRLLWLALAAAGLLLLLPLLVFIVGLLVYPFGFVLGAAGSSAGAGLIEWWNAVVAAAFAGDALPTWLPRTVTVVVSVAAILIVGRQLLVALRARERRHLRGNRAWELLGAPFEHRVALEHFGGGLLRLLRGGPPSAGLGELGPRYCDQLADNLGQPGFRELLLLVHDIDARRDLAFALLRPAYRRGFFATTSDRELRSAEAFDLSGPIKTGLASVLTASLSVPAATRVPLLSFPVDTFWRGERHRVTDRPGALSRMLEEARRAGAEQLLLVSAAPEGPGVHAIVPPRTDALGALGELSVAAEAVALREAEPFLVEGFKGAWVVRPDHNPVRAFDLAARFDSQSDRDVQLPELMQRGYQDAYRDFIEPIVGGSGEAISRREGEHG